MRIDWKKKCINQSFIWRFIANRTRRCFPNGKRLHLYRCARAQYAYTNSHMTHSRNRYTCEINKRSYINKYIYYIYKYYIDAIRCASRNIYGADMREREKREENEKNIYSSIYLYIFTYFQSKPLIDYYNIYVRTYTYIYIYYVYTFICINMVKRVVSIARLREPRRSRVAPRRLPGERVETGTHTCDPTGFEESIDCVESSQVELPGVSARSERTRNTTICANWLFNIFDRRVLVIIFPNILNCEWSSLMYLS